MTAFEVPREHLIGNFRERKPKEKQTSAETKRERMAPGYLAKVRKLPCCICDAMPPSEAHHLKSAGRRGLGQKTANKWTVPLCEAHHRTGVDAVERVALPATKKEAAWFMARGISCYDLALALHANAHDFARMCDVFGEHRCQRIERMKLDRTIERRG